MLNFKQFLEEGRDAPLYHGTDATLKILETNTLKGTRSHSYQSLMIDKDGEAKGVSLTRNIKVASQFQKWADHSNYAIFELDQKKLAQNHKIIPVNFWGALKGEPARSKSIPKDEVGSEYEEFVMGDIKNLDKYIIRIFIFSKKSKLYGKPNVLLVKKNDLILGKHRRR
jgi:hypothetical protein